MEHLKIIDSIFGVEMFREMVNFYNENETLSFKICSHHLQHKEAGAETSILKLLFKYCSIDYDCISDQNMNNLVLRELIIHTFQKFVGEHLLGIQDDNVETGKTKLQTLQQYVKG